MSQSAALIVVLLLCIPAGRAAGDKAACRDALAALQRGDFRAAEKKLRPEVAAHPNDAPSLSLLGVALDNQNQFREAAGFHRRAIAAAPRAGDILGNYGNHLAATGEEAAAHVAFLKAIALDPANANANRARSPEARALLAGKTSAGPNGLFLDRLPREW